MSIPVASDIIPVGPYKLLRAEHIIGASAWPWNYATVAAVRAGATAVEQPHIEVGASRYQWVAASSAVDDGTEATDAILPTGQAPEVTGRWVRIADASDIPDATDATGGLLTDAQAAKLAGIQAGALASAAVTDIANARASAAVGAIPDVTATTGGLLTDVQAVKLNGIEAGALASAAVTAIASNVATGLIASSQVLSYYLANWAATDWYLDSVNGSDSNNGITSGTALASAEELSRRLAVACPIAHAVTVHVAPGTYGTLAVSVVQTAVACPFDVVGTPVLTSIGTVTSYTDRVVASNQASHLVASGVSDWTSHVGKMVVVTDGASVGAVSWIAKANPNNGAGVAQGVGTARCSQFSTQATNLGGTAKVPDTGSALSVATLPTIKKISINCRGQLPELFANTYASRLCRVSNLSVESVTLSGGRGLLVESCEIGNVEFLQSRNTYSQMILRSKIKGWPGLSLVEISAADLNNCLFLSPNATSLKITDGRIYDSLIQGAYLVVEQVFALDVGIFDQPNAFFGACLLLAQRSARSTIASVFGRDNAREGLSVATTSVVCVAVTNYVTGASGDVRVSATTPYFLPWSALPYIDGEQSGEATLIGGTVDVTVRTMPIATQKMQVSVKTLAGTPGFLSVVYVNATTIRITSSSATDTSVVTWHILPVGDNVVIRG